MKTRLCGIAMFLVFVCSVKYMCVWKVSVSTISSLVAVGQRAVVNIEPCCVWMYICPLLQDQAFIETSYMSVPFSMHDCYGGLHKNLCSCIGICSLYGAVQCLIPVVLLRICATHLPSKISIKQLFLVNINWLSVSRF